MSDDNDLHGKLLSFLAGEIARKEGRQCVAVGLFYAPGGGFREEEIRTWAREDEPELFDKFVCVENLVSSIIEIAEGEADAKSAGKHRFVVRTRQHLGGRAIQSFVRSPTHSGECIEDEDMQDKEESALIVLRVSACDIIRFPRSDVRRVTYRVSDDEGKKQRKRRVAFMTIELACGRSYLLEIHNKDPKNVADVLKDIIATGVGRVDWCCNKAGEWDEANDENVKDE
jgi:hypothetical protein